MDSSTEVVLVAYHPKSVAKKIQIREHTTWDREVLMDNLCTRYGGQMTLIEIITPDQAAYLLSTGAVRVEHVI